MARQVPRSQCQQVPRQSCSQVPRGEETLSDSFYSLIVILFKQRSVDRYPDNSATMFQVIIKDFIIIIIKIIIIEENCYTVPRQQCSSGKLSILIKLIVRMMTVTVVRSPHYLLIFSSI